MAWRVARIQLASRPEGRETVCPQPFQVPRNVVAMGWRAVFSGAQTLRGGERLLRKSARERRVRKGESHMREETSAKTQQTAIPASLCGDVDSRSVAHWWRRPVSSTSRSSKAVCVLAAAFALTAVLGFAPSKAVTEELGNAGTAYEETSQAPGGRRFFRPAVIRRQWLGCSKHGAGLGYRP